MSKSGATNSGSSTELSEQAELLERGIRAKPASADQTQPEQADSATLDDFFLPDFCVPSMVLAVVLISELLAVTLTLARPSEAGFLQELARVSMFMQWLGLTGATVLCYSRRWLARMTVPMASFCAFGLLMVLTGVVSEAAFQLGRQLSEAGVGSMMFPGERWGFLLRNLGICGIVTAMLLRYFFVTHESRRHVRAEARSRISALQARIRPHFLFNSMNTIASLTRTSPKLAEEAVEDLADLFRATLKDSARPLRLKEELELSRMYQRIEALRLGSRLQVRWDVAGLPMRALVPSLTIQPLLENAIYHGIEPLDGGGTVEVKGSVDGSDIAISVANPVAVGERRNSREGNRVALENIRQRLRLAYGHRGRVEVEETPGRYEVTLRFPYEQ
jgi:two-component system sensor histidine kinase AlgZ